MKRIIAYFADLLNTLHEIRNELRELNRRCDARFRGDQWDYKRSFR